MRKSKAKRINYGEGTCFFVPLRSGGYARGIVSRLDGDGGIFAYFFGPELARPEGSFGDIHAQEALLSGRCGDLGLVEGGWPLADQLKDWNRNDWPLPALYREDAEAQKAWVSYYDNDNLKFVREESVEFGQEQHKRHPHDRLMGYGAAEIRITKLLE